MWLSCCFCSREFDGFGSAVMWFGNRRWQGVYIYIHGIQSHGTSSASPRGVAFGTEAHQCWQWMGPMGRPCWAGYGRATPPPNNLGIATRDKGRGSDPVTIFRFCHTREPPPNIVFRTHTALPCRILHLIRITDWLYSGRFRHHLCIYQARVPRGTGLLAGTRGRVDVAQFGMQSVDEPAMVLRCNVIR